MINTEKYLQPHALFVDQTFKEYCSNIPKFYFKKDVPEDVIQNFEVVEKLLAYSYFEYKFIDEAFTKAIMTFEMAMKIRCKDFIDDNKRRTFNPLIRELSKLDLFETSFEVLKYVNEIRNIYAHPDRHSFGGIVIWNKIEFLSLLINEMYEDVALRLERRKLTEDFINNLKKADLQKSLVMEIEGEQTILYSMELLFFNNKRIPTTSLLVCIPLFNLAQNGDSIIVPLTFKSKISNPVFIDGTLTGESFIAKKKVTFSPIRKHPELLTVFQKWYSDYDKTNKRLFELSMNSAGNKYYVPEIKEFQEM